VDTTPLNTRRPTSHSYFSQRLRLHYLDWGQPPELDEAPALLLVHGIQDHCRSWDWFAEAFLDRFRVIAPDLRGHGDSEWAQGGAYQQLDYVYDLAQLVEQAELAPVTMVAHSMGGSLAALYAGAYPDSVARLVSIEGIGLWPGWTQGMAADRRVREWVRGNRDLAGRLVRRYSSLDEAVARMQRANPHLSPDQARHLTVHGANQNEDGTYSWKFDNYTHAWGAYGIPQDQIVQLWSSITCPVLILNADGGFDHRIGHDGTDAYFRDVRVETITDAGHWAHHDQLDEVVVQCELFFG
jgi:pimeloyl-ACP methyl ester carboxylesterase